MAKCSMCSQPLTRLSERLFGGCVSCMVANPSKFTAAIQKEAK